MNTFDSLKRLQFWTLHFLSLFIVIVFLEEIQQSCSVKNILGLIIGFALWIYTVFLMFRKPTEHQSVKAEEKLIKR